MYISIVDIYDGFSVVLKEKIMELRHDVHAEYYRGPRDDLGYFAFYHQ